MRFDGEFAFLSEKEVCATGIESPFELREVNIKNLGDEILCDRQEIESFRASTDTHDHASMCWIFEAEERQERRLTVLGQLANETDVVIFADKLASIDPDEFLDLTR